MTNPASSPSRAAEEPMTNRAFSASKTVEEPRTNQSARLAGVEAGNGRIRYSSNRVLRRVLQARCCCRARGGCDDPRRPEGGILDGPPLAHDATTRGRQMAAPFHVARLA